MIGYLIVVTFFLAAATDFLYIRFWKSVASDRVWTTIFWSIILSTVNLLGVYVFVWEPWTIPFTLAGHGVGCYLSMRLK
jgi:hypothetical protein